ncbi:MAG: Gfo/Idh/MocA family oxidoreductase [Armatimonadetes bacterium]|nr:Gfo/Idh/MocA family oxidoreductase [Armatimonadota bacterium]
MTAEYRVAVIGRTGRGNYGHDLDTVWLDLEEAEVVAVADEDERGRAQAAQRLGVPRTYADYREMLEEERPDIVSVAPRWLDCHRDMVIACAEHGCHVFLEKPMCRTLAEADEMIAACERANVKLALAHQTRYSPRLQRVQEMIADGTLGEILELRGRGKEDGRGGGEDLIVLGSHVMDLIRLLVGDPKWCFARVLEEGERVSRKHVREGAEGLGPLAGDCVDAVYGFDGSAPAHFSTHRNAGGQGQRFGLRVHGSKGVLDLGTGSLPRALFLDDPQWGVGGHEWVPVSSAGIGQPEPLPDGGLRQGNSWIARDLILAIEKDTQPRGSMYDGRSALEMILSVYESHRLNAPVTLPLENREHPLSLL